MTDAIATYHILEMAISVVTKNACMVCFVGLFFGDVLFLNISVARPLPHLQLFRDPATPSGVNQYRPCILHLVEFNTSDDFNAIAAIILRVQ